MLTSPSSALVFLTEEVAQMPYSVNIMEYKSLGDKIRKLRKQKDLTQEELAELASIDPKSVIQIENGKRNPTLNTIDKIAKALKVPASQLLPS